MKLSACLKGLVLLCLASSNVYGLGMTNEEFIRRTGIAQQKIVAADEIESNIQNYERSRERLIYSNDGVYARAVDVQKTTSEWISRWNQYLNTFDQIDIPDYSRFMADSQSFFLSQSTSLNLIKNQLEQIRRIVVDSQDEIAFFFSSTADLTSEQKSRISRLKAAVDDLRLSLNRMNIDVRSHIGLLQMIQDKSMDAVTLKVKQRLLNQSKIPVESALAQYKELVAAMQLMSPIKSLLENEANDMSQYSLNFAIQHAKKLKTQADADCAKGRDQVKDSSLSEGTKASSLKTINALCSAIDTSWTALLTSGLSEAEMVYEFASLMKVKFADQCRAADIMLDCSGFNILSLVPYEFYREATAVELQDIEYRWSSIDTMKK